MLLSLILGKLGILLKTWVSASKEIGNPYFGSEILKYGSVQQVISVK